MKSIVTSDRNELHGVGFFDYIVNLAVETWTHVIVLLIVIYLNNLL
jgi:hypothetical protein